MKVTKNMVVGEVLQLDDGISKILVEAGMFCLGCPSSQVESILDACVVHNMDCDKLIDDINAHLEKVGK